MPMLKQITFASMLVFALLTTAAAQESTTAQRSSLTITASASGDRVRISAPSSVVQMHVEVYAASGEKLFDQEIRGGNVFDWHLQDGQAQRLAPGTYVCLVTAKSVSGKLTQKIGAVNVEEKSVSVQPAESPKLSVQQTQAIGPVEENSSWTIAAKDEPQTGTVIAHDGTDGQMIRGRGALTFRIGNFFSGLDTEQMRLTEDGRLGIGTSNPRSTLDVAGTIRAERFLVAKPNTSVGDIKAQAPDAADSFQPLIAGTGTLNRIAKWTPDGSTLGDSGITETAGLVGIGTPTPTQALEVANGRIVTTGNQTLAAAGGILEIGTTLTNNNNAASGIRMRNTFNGNASIQQALDVAPTFAPSASISLARGFISSAFFAPPAGVTITDAFGGNANTLYNNTGGAVTNGTAFAIRSPIVFGALKPTTQYGLHINNQGIGGTTNSYGLFVDAQSGSANNYSAVFAGGNVGIGTTSPVSELQVNGEFVIDAAGPTLHTGAAVGEQNRYLHLINSPFFRSASGLKAGGILVADSYDYANPGKNNLIVKGNVGIGITSPIFKLDVEVGGFSSAIYGQSSDGFGVQGESVGTGVGVIARSHSGNLVEGKSTATGLILPKFHITNDGTYVAGSDFAEALPVRGDSAGYEPGDVLVVSAKVPGKVEKASRPYDPRVAGIYSTRPGMLGADKNGTSRVDKDEVPVAIVGIVPTKVSAMNGRIRVGDLLTTSSTPGYAMRCANRVKCVGAIVGKALEPLAGGRGVIKVLVMLR